MLGWTFQLAVLWLAGLILILTLYVLRCRRATDRLVGFDALSTVFVAVLGVLGVHRQEAFYFDIALVVAMLGFVQTVATVRLLEQRREIE